MTRFLFPLERVRQYRCLQMEAAQSRLEQLLTKLQALDPIEKDLEHQRRSAEGDQRTQTRTGSRVENSQIGAMSDYRSYLNHVAQSIAARRADLQHKIQTQRLELVEARRRYEVLNRFRERQESRWQAAFGREVEQLAAENYLARWKTI